MDSILKTAVWLSLISVAILLYEFGFLWPIVKFIVSLILFLTSISIIFHYIKKWFKDMWELTPEEKKALREKKNAKS
ncbi:MAG: hypothetical protein OXS28_02305 [Gammaproteobacteria bacterium]|nr:hypothetical protein [Gammaproteobacteria bacterium]